MMISMLKDITMTAKEKSNIPRTVVTMAPVPCTSILTLVMGLQKYNMTPCHVVFLSARTKGRRPKVRGGELS